MNIRRRLLISLAVLFLAVAWPLEGQPAGPGDGRDSPPTYREDFDDREAAGWELEPGWTLERHPTGELCLRGRRHRWARYLSGEWQDSTLRLRLHLPRGGVHLNVRVDEARRYFVGLRPEGLYLSKQTGPETFFENLATAERRVPTEHFVDVEIVARGAVLEVRLDGETVLSYTDPEPLRGGGIAVETLADGEVWIDRLAVSEVSEAAPATVELTDTELIAMQLIELAAPRYVPTGPPETPATVIAATTEMVVPAGLQRVLRWTSTGGPLGGLGYDVRMTPGRPGFMYVSDAWAGAFKSADGGIAPPAGSISKIGPGPSFS